MEAIGSPRNIITQVLVIVALLSPALAQQQRTTDAFNKYIREGETRITKERSRPDSFLKIDSLPAAQRNAILARLRQGAVVIQTQGDTPTPIPAGLIHDWIGTVLIPKSTVAQVLALIQDYDHTTRHYSPDVVRSRLISHQGDDFQVFMRLRKHKVITVVLDTEYNVHYSRFDAAHQYSFSRSTRVTEIADPGTSTEHAFPAGKDHGFMWRLNSYWAFEQTDEGVIVECEAISLTRDIPTGLGWMIGPFVNSIPKESLEFTLGATRKALEEK